ncbi:Acylglycerol kinase, mitochondrial [Bagarius yarrelli]|uniref:Acylglycerol kinase, mitochondrial n=1 Tax=Bagarius yarrelli TaxID=175774 RepID=A0A556V6U4_BAGYA|nr:Acylglycerol kinase, mitochondrial [Bagarius yarrelli]
MARVVKVLRTLRNHWKKSTFAVCVLSYGGHWLYGKHCDSVLRREACQEAREFGRKLIGPQESLQKATVILNPAASKGKANSLFEKNAAPILHLAGIEVKVIKTDYEGQAKKLMDLMEQTDMLIVAGGDGTLQEVITGLLRRADQSEKEQPVFALLSLRWGSFRDVATSVSKYWYLGPLKTRAAHWFSSLREWPQTHDASVSFLPPVPRPPDLPDVKPVRPSLLYRIYRRLKNYWTPPAEVKVLPLTLIYPGDDVICVIGCRIKKAENPLENTEQALQMEASVCRLNVPQEGAGFYDIDNEAFEAVPVEVKLLPRKLRFFCSSERKDQLAQIN